MESRNVNVPAIVVDNVSKRYGYLWALKNVSFQVDPNAITGIIGENGSGKTTLLNLIGTTIAPSSGRLTLDGIFATKQSEKHRERIALMSYQPFLYEDLTGWENLRFWSKISSTNDQRINRLEQEKRTVSLAKDFGIENWLGRPIKELSTGMKKKVDFMRIFLANPRILLLDEPFSGMDSKNKRVIVKNLNLAKTSSTILVASHDLEELAGICSRVLVFRKGVLVKILDGEKVNRSSMEEIIDEM